MSRSLTILFLFFSLSVCYAAETFNSPIGFWKTIDDVSGQAKSIVQISESDDHVLSGRIVKLFKEPEKRCVACEGKNHNQAIMGMEVISNLQQDQENRQSWQGGSILDPKNGKSYHCQIQLSKNGRKLNVRGYIGLPLFGRSQTWERLAS